MAVRSRSPVQDWIMATIFLDSVSDTSVGLRRCRFRFRDLVDRIWLLNAFHRLNLPEAVFLNRFFAPEVDFILGIAYSLGPFFFCFLFRFLFRVRFFLRRAVGSEDHHHAASLEFWLLVDFRHIG